jgi:pimeloyl-ACP methyl ester carboxylesterase
MPLRPDTRFARAGGIDIAYQVFGDGPVDLVWVPGWISHLEYMWELPEFASFLNRLARFSRVIAFDKRGVGLSDRTQGVATLEERMDDVRAVMDAAGSSKAALVGWFDASALLALFAASFPERTVALVVGRRRPRWCRTTISLGDRTPNSCVRWRKFSRPGNGGRPAT